MASCFIDSDSSDDANNEEIEKEFLKSEKIKCSKSNKKKKQSFRLRKFDKR